MQNYYPTSITVNTYLCTYKNHTAQKCLLFLQAQSNFLLWRNSP